MSVSVSLGQCTLFHGNSLILTGDCWDADRSCTVVQLEIAQKLPGCWQLPPLQRRTSHVRAVAFKRNMEAGVHDPSSSPHSHGVMRWESSQNAESSKRRTSTCCLELVHCFELELARAVAFQKIGFTPDLARRYHGRKGGLKALFLPRCRHCTPGSESSNRRVMGSIWKLWTVGGMSEPDSAESAPDAGKRSPSPSANATSSPKPC